MKEVEPSVTALRVAGRRAAHQLFDEPKVFLDPYAVPILGAAEAARLAASGWRERGPLSTALRAWMVARSRFAEDELARARERGTEQYVILGAGLDTFAYRHPPDERPLTVFEVDHPATQRWKRARLAEAGIPVPPSVRYVATNFETGRLADDLAAVGWDRSTPTFFAWLGVTMYLTSAATGSMLNFLGATPPGGGVALDYFVRGGPRSPVERLARGESPSGWRGRGNRSGAPSPPASSPAGSAASDFALSWTWAATRSTPGTSPVGPTGCGWVPPRSG